MRYTLKHIEYFVAAAHATSVADAAQRVGISSASISMAISHLEEEFAVKLFSRHFSKGMELTPAGKVFLERANTLLEIANGFYDDAHALTAELRGEIGIGCLVTLAPILFPPIARSIARRYPDVSVNYVEGGQDLLISKLRREEIDFALTYKMHLPDDIEFDEYHRLEPKVMVSVDHPLAGRGRVNVQEIAREPYILLDLPVSRDYFFGIFAQADCKANIVMRSSQPEVVQAMVANGLGLTITVCMGMGSSIDGKETVAVPLESDAGRISVGVIRKPTRFSSSVQTAFAKAVREMVMNGSIPGYPAATAR